MLPLLTILACSSPEPAPTASVDAAERLTVVFSSRMDGEIEPCG